MSTEDVKKKEFGMPSEDVKAPSKMEKGMKSMDAKEGKNDPMTENFSAPKM